MLKFDYKFFDSTIYTYKDSSRSPQKFKETEMFTCSGPKGVLVLASRRHPIGGGHYDPHLVKSGPEGIVDNSTSVLFEEFRERFSICTTHLGADFPGEQVFFEFLQDFYTEKVLTNKFKYTKEAE